MQQAHLLSGERIFSRSFSDPKHALFFAIGSFVIFVLSMGTDFQIGFLLPILLFELFPLGYALTHPRKVRVLANDTFISVQRQFLFGRPDIMEQYEISKLNDWHLLRSVRNTNTGITYFSLCFSIARGDSQALVPAMKLDEIDRLVERLSRFVPDLTETPQARYIQLGQLSRQYGWVLGVILLFPVVGTIGFMSADAPAQKIQFPLELSASQQALLEPELEAECAGKEYCIVAFFATWCSISQSSRHIVPALRSHFGSKGEVGVAEFVRDTSWGQPGADQDEWQRDLQRTLRLGFSVPGFALVKNGRTLLSTYTGGVSGTAPEFLSKHLGAEYLE